jgi:hypothetical protein
MSVAHAECQSIHKDHDKFELLLIIKGFIAYLIDLNKLVIYSPWYFNGVITIMNDNIINLYS